MLIFEALEEVKAMQVFSSTNEQKEALEMAQKALEAQQRLADVLNELVLDSQNELYENDTYSIGMLCDILDEMRWDYDEEDEEE